MKRFYWLLTALLFLSNSFLYSAKIPKHEIRAVWLTTVYGLDWPHFYATNDKSIKAQKDSLCRILDKLQDANFNTVFFQTRLRGDVIYRSAIEPSAKILTGKYGRSLPYDPLSFAIEECHKRGMECHAWFVTFPVGTDKTVAEQGKQSVVKRHPKLCKKHKGEWYLDPGVPGTSDYILSLVREIVDNYDIDGIHFDYIRYPEEAKKFPDQTLYKKNGKKQTLADWRRNNINKIMERIYCYVKSVKPWVQVSSAPLGKYSRIPKAPNAGWTAYESVYQDPKYWMGKGIHDMVVPMMYYKFDNFFPFLDNWVENSNGRLVVPGLGAYRTEVSEGNWELNDITDQIDYSRYYGGAGCAFFRCENILDNKKGIYDILKNEYFRYPAMLPPLNWLDSVKPNAPENLLVERIGNELKLSWSKPKEEKQDLSYTIYCSTSDSIDYESPASIISTGLRDTVVYLPVDTAKERIFNFSVSASSRYHQESIHSEEAFYYLSKYLK